MTEGPRLFSAKMAGRERQRASCDRGESETRAQCIHDPRIAELLREPRLIERADDDGGKGDLSTDEVKVVRVGEVGLEPGDQNHKPQQGQEDPRLSPVEESLEKVGAHGGCGGLFRELFLHVLHVGVHVVFGDHQDSGINRLGQRFAIHRLAEFFYR